MNNVMIAQSLRFVILLILQVLIFKRVSLAWEGFNYVSVFIIPIFIILLPHRTSHALSVLLGFVFGLAVDVFYNSPGVHASAMVLIAFVRPFILKIYEPRGGYAQNLSPTKSQLGINVFVFYAATMLIIYLLTYFSVLAFSFVYIGEILLRTISSFFPSLLFIVIYQYLFDPKS